jgi:hypothetical protein
VKTSARRNHSQGMSQSLPPKRNHRQRIRDEDAVKPCDAERGMRIEIRGIGARENQGSA